MFFEDGRFSVMRGDFGRHSASVVSAGAQTLGDVGPPEAAELALIRRCQGADETAWRALYERHYPFVYGVARRLGTPPAEADDVAQEVFMVVHQKLGRFRQGKLTTWLYRITANVASHRHRKRRAQRRVAEWRSKLGLSPPECPEAAAVARGAARAVDHVLERMSPKRREVFALFELEGLSGEEIAERVGCPLGTVWSRLRLGREEFLRIARQLRVLEEGTAP